MRYYLTPEPDPQSDEKIANINQLYQTAQERAERGKVIVSMDERTGVQAREPKHLAYLSLSVLGGWIIAKIVIQDNMRHLQRDQIELNRAYHPLKLGQQGRQDWV